MKLIRDPLDPQLNIQNCVLTIGNFDGVHLGHAAILKSLKQKATELNLPSVVMIFEPQPLEFLHPDSAPTRLTSLREKYHLIEQFGIDFVYVLRFNRLFSQLSPINWIQKYLVDTLKIKLLLIGDDFRFGQDRHGDFTLLQQQNFTVIKVKTIQKEDVRISSTLIRSYLNEANLKSANQLLGRSYSILGNVIYGNQLARKLGFPTANLNMDRKKPALRGVYSVKVHHKETNQFYFGVANIGFRPTINGKKAVLETHLFNFDKTIYGDHLEVIFLEKIREEKKFDSLDALKEAIAQDICIAKKIQAE